MGRARDRARPPLSQRSQADDGRYFDRLVRDDGDFDPFTARGWRTLARRFAKVIPGSGLRLLDVGCGTGRSEFIYREHCAGYTGIDLSLVAVRRAHQELTAGRVLQADALQMPFPAASFDVVAFSSVLHHIGDRRAALGEALRVLRPGGWSFAFDPNLLHPAMLLFRSPRSPLYSSKGVSPNEAPLMPGALREDFAAAGFGPIGQRCQSDLPYRRVAPAGLRSLLPLYNQVDWLWEKVGLGRWFGTFVVTWGRKP